MKNKEKEYERLNQELLMRVKNSYGDGIMLASFYLIYYATSIAALVQLIIAENNILTFVSLGLISSIVFCMPIIVMFAFSIKYKENFLGICNISAYLRIYHELPTLNDICGNELKWEIAHKDTISPSAKFENKEYFFLSIMSIVSMIFGITVTIINGIKGLAEKHFLIAFILIVMISVVSLAVGIIFSIKVYKTTNLNKLKNEIQNMNRFYIRQTRAINPVNQSMFQTFEKYEQTNQLDGFLENILYKIGADHTKGAEFINLYLKDEFDENDYYLKKAIELLEKNKHKIKDELLEDKRKEIINDYYEKMNKYEFEKEALK